MLKVAKEIRDHRITLIGLVVTIFVILSSTMWYYSVVNKEINTAVQNKMLEISRQLKFSLEVIVDETVDDLSLLAKYVVKANVNSDNVVSFFESQSHVEEFDNLYYIDIFGNGISASNVYRDLSKNTTFLHALKNDFAISKPHISRTTDDFVFDVAVPIKKSGQVIGVLLAETSMDGFQEIIKEITKGSGLAFVFDKKLALLYTNAAEYKNASFSFEEVEEMFGAETVNTALSNIKKNVGGSFIYEYKGIQKVGVYSPIEMTNWFLAVSIKKEEIDQSLHLTVDHVSSVVIVIFIIFSMHVIAMLYEIIIKERELRVAKEIAEQSTKAKGDFLANMSHEIRTPMNGVLGLLRLLEHSTLDAVQTNFVQKAIFSANELLHIINDILDFSKIEAGKLDMEIIPFTLHDISSQLENLLGHIAEKKNITLQINENEFANTLIMGDPLRLKQVLLNLLSNAIKFTNEGGVDLEIYSTLHEDELHCKFAVIDTGIGLKPEQIENLFSAFTQADSTMTRKYGGTGLGLAISKSIMSLMHGETWVESEYGKGSTFFCTVKFALAAQDTLENVDSLSVGDDTTLTNSHKGHILLTEDNEINQLVAQEILYSKGYTVDIANNGQEALDMLEKNSYDAILMDIQMPIMDGYTATEKIREQEKFINLPIIAMSAHAMVGVKEESISHGMNDHITKPIDIEKLCQVLHFWISTSTIISSDGD